MTSKPKQARNVGRSAPSNPGMKEVADRAGVALSSVSRVLSGHPDVSDVMRNRVLDAVAALGYERNVLAQSLRTGDTKSIGFLVGDISNPLMSQIALGAETRLRASGYSTMLANSFNDPELNVEHLRFFKQRHVDGLLLSLSEENNPEINAALDTLDVPGVFVDREVDGSSFAAVLSDHATGIRAAVDHLYELGHRRIGLVNGNPKVRPTRERARALRAASRSLPGVTTVVKSSTFSAEHGYRAATELLGQPDADRPTALIAGSNQILVGVLGALRDLDVTFPDDVSLVTCDDVPLAEFITPPITTISRDSEAMGNLAAELLLEQLAGDDPRTVVLPTTFRATASCAPPFDQ